MLIRATGPNHHSVMQQKTARLLAASLLCVCLLANGCRREGFSQLAPATYLSWSGTQWDICDNADRTRGIESLPGGIVIASNVTAVQVVGKDRILAKDNSGKWLLIKVDEWGPEDVQSFAIEREWLDAVKAAGVTAPSLRDPAQFYK